MGDAYQEDVYLDEYDYEPEPKRGMSGGVIALLVILGIIIVCCLCIFVVIAGVALTGPVVGNVFSEIITAMPTPP